MPAAKKRRKFKGFAAFDRSGNLIWGTLATTAERAQAIHDRHNPDATGAGQGETIKPVTLYPEE